MSRPAWIAHFWPSTRTAQITQPDLSPEYAQPPAVSAAAVVDAEHAYARRIGKLIGVLALTAGYLGLGFFILNNGDTKTRIDISGESGLAALGVLATIIIGLQVAVRAPAVPGFGSEAEQLGRQRLLEKLAHVCALGAMGLALAVVVRHQPVQSIVDVPRLIAPLAGGALVAILALDAGLASERRLGDALRAELRRRERETVRTVANLPERPWKLALILQFLAGSSAAVLCGQLGDWAQLFGSTGLNYLFGVAAFLYMSLGAWTLAGYDLVFRLRGRLWHLLALRIVGASVGGLFAVQLWALGTLSAHPSDVAGVAAVACWAICTTLFPLLCAYLATSRVRRSDGPLRKAVLSEYRRRRNRASQAIPRTPVTWPLILLGLIPIFGLVIAQVGLRMSSDTRARRGFRNAVIVGTLVLVVILAVPVSLAFAPSDWPGVAEFTRWWFPKTSSGM